MGAGQSKYFVSTVKDCHYSATVLSKLPEIYKNGEKLTERTF